MTLNDPVYVEAAVALGKQAAKQPGDKLTWLTMQTLSRAPSPPEAKRLLALHAKARAKYAADAKLATALVGTPDPDTAAWAVVANVVLNLDEMLMKR